MEMKSTYLLYQYTNKPSNTKLTYYCSELIFNYSYIFNDHFLLTAGISGSNFNYIMNNSILDKDVVFNPDLEKTIQFQVGLETKLFESFRFYFNYKTINDNIEIENEYILKPLGIFNTTSALSLPALLSYGLSYTINYKYNIYGGFNHSHISSYYNTEYFSNYGSEYRKTKKEFVNSEYFIGSKIQISEYLSVSGSFYNFITLQNLSNQNLYGYPPYRILFEYENMNTLKLGFDLHYEEYGFGLDYQITNAELKSVYDTRNSISADILSCRVSYQF